MRHSRCVVDAKDIRGIAGIWRQDGYVGFELLQYVFDFLWPVKRLLVEFQIKKTTVGLTKILCL